MIPDLSIVEVMSFLKTFVPLLVEADTEATLFVSEKDGTVLTNANQCFPSAVMRMIWFFRFVLVVLFSLMTRAVFDCPNSSPLPHWPSHMKNALKEGRVERGTDLFGFSVNLLFLRFSLSFYSVTSLRNKAGKSKFYQQ